MTDIIIPWPTVAVLAGSAALLSGVANWFYYGPKSRLENALYRLSRVILIVAVPLYLYCLILLSFVFAPWSWFALAMIASLLIANRQGRIALTAHGTARTATETDLRRAGMINGSGLILGRLMGGRRLNPFGGIKALFDRALKAKDACALFFRKKMWGSLLVTMSPVHAAIFAPAGAGKSTGMVIPFLRTSPESCVVIDLKGELSLATAWQRYRMGHEIYVLDPYGVVAKPPCESATLNPLDFIHKDDPEALDKCNDIANALIVRTGKQEGNSAHFDDIAEECLSSFTATVVGYAKDGQRSLQQVADLLSSPEKVDGGIELMRASPLWGGLLARRGGQLAHRVDKEKSGMLSVVSRHTRFLNTPQMIRATSTSSFDPRDLKRRLMTVYLVLPPEHMRAQAGWLRLMVTTLMRSVIGEGLGEFSRVHWVLDEAASLGALEPLEDLVDKYRGYGCRAQFYYQSVGQLKPCWPKDEGRTLLSNCAKVFFGTADYDTGKLVSDMAGKSTIIVESGGEGESGGGNKGWSDGQNVSWSGGRNWGRSSNHNWQQSPRELWKPEEVLALDPRVAISFPGGGVPPVLTYMIRYFEEPWLGGRRRSGSTWSALFGP